MRKPAFCICENKDADQLREADQRLCFRYTDSTIQVLYYLNPKFQASNHLLGLYSLVCVGPGRKPERWFSHDAAYLSVISNLNFRDVLSDGFIKYKRRTGDEL